MIRNYNIIALVGPTACGKTRLAVKIAERYSGEIISGDSRQVYRGMDIGTGKDLEEYFTPSGKIPFHLIDIADPAEDYNLYRYLNDFRASFDSIVQKGNLPILCGGSGLYIEGALKRYDLPDIPEDRVTRDELEGRPKEELLSILKKESPDILERTDISSSRRIIRSIEIARFLKVNDLPLNPGTGITPCRPLIIGIRLPRQEIIRRIEQRLDNRLEAGMVEEVSSLMNNGVPEEKLIKLGLEYRYCALYLCGKISFTEMRDKLCTEIRRFAKRQMTWFRGMERRGLPIHWIDGDDFTAACVIIDQSGLQTVFP